MTVEERLGRLERENRRLKLGGALILAMISAVVLMGQARPTQQDLRVRSVTIVNSKGDDVGTFGISDADLPYIGISSVDVFDGKDTHGYVVAGLDIAEQISANGKGIVPRFSLSRCCTGTAGPRVEITINQLADGGSPYAVMYSTEAKGIWNTPLAP